MVRETQELAQIRMGLEEAGLPGTRRSRASGRCGPQQSWGPRGKS